MKQLVSFLFVLILSSIGLSSTPKYFVVEEGTDSGKILYKVIEISNQSTSSQSAITQNVIYKKISSAGQSQKILKEAQVYRKNHLKTLTDSMNELNKEGKPLWVTKQDSWTEQDEIEYSQWFEKNASKSFNLKSNLLADCADTGLLFRWVYARDHQLPIANTMVGSGKLFGHFSGSAAWDKLPTDPDWKKDERFKQAMRYLFDNTYTGTVYSDLYPTQINANFVHPGSMYMIIRQNSGHTQSIYHLDKEMSAIRTLWGNEPARESVYESWIIWEPAVKNLFGAWRWPSLVQGQWKLIKGIDMPGYSTEQFTQRKLLGEKKFQEWVLKNLGMTTSADKLFEQEVQNLRDNLDFRLNITVRGTLICGYQHCDESGVDYDAYSTHSRDQRMLVSHKKIDSLMEVVSFATFQNVIAKYKLSDEFLNKYSYYHYILYSSSTLLDIMQPSANLKFHERWGFDNSKISIDQQFINIIRFLSEGLKMRSEDVSQRKNSVQIDIGFKGLADDLNKLLLSSELTNEQLLQSIEEMKKIPVIDESGAPLKSTQCKDANLCNMADAVINWDSSMKVINFNKMKLWKSQAQDSIKSRWGI